MPIETANRKPQGDWGIQLNQTNLYGAMKDRGITTVAGLASTAGLSRTCLTEALNGHREPSPRLVGRLAKALTVHPAQITNWALK